MDFKYTHKKHHHSKTKISVWITREHTQPNGHIRKVTTATITTLIILLYMFPNYLTSDSQNKSEKMGLGFIVPNL